MKDNKEKFIEKANKKHNKYYDYSKVEYLNSLTKVCIICPEHGEFWQIPSAHIRGYGCPICGRKNQGRFKKSNNDEFIKRAKEIHGDKYDYSKVKYINASTKICIICPEHGEFWQIPQSHLLGYGCQKCIGFHRSNDDIIKLFNEKHSDKYDYSQVNFEKMDKKVSIRCKIHGLFQQTPSKHLSGQGCPICGKEHRIQSKIIDCNSFIQKSKEIHGDKYDYSHVILNGMRNKVDIICKKHGIFKQFPFDHINGHGCPKCGIIVSNAENEIYDYICQYINKDDIIRNDRVVLKGKEIDIYIPSIKVGIEYNGLKWHSEEFGKDSHYHLDKLLIAQQNDVKLIQVFEDEYINHKEIVLNKISHLIGCDCNKEHIFGRKCKIKDIDKSIAKDFLNKYHIQGYSKCSLCYGAFYNDILIAVMCFLDNNNGNWELVRFASDYNKVFSGVGGKLFNTFIKNNTVYSIKTFADRRWSINEDNNLYTKLGFIKDAILKPDYRYIDPNKPNERFHKFSFRKWSIHNKYGLSMNLTETQMCKELGFKKIWDCGLIRYIWKSKKK